MLLTRTLPGMLDVAGSVLVSAPLPAALAQTCGDDSDCNNPDKPFCHLVFRTCVECLVDSQCDDGLFCNGEEECRIDGCRRGWNPTSVYRAGWTGRRGLAIPHRPIQNTALVSP